MTMHYVIIVFLGLITAARAGDLAFSDPGNVAPVPAYAVGQASRAPDLDVAPGFQKPPAGFGVVPFFWWLGDPLTRERLTWILGQMDGMGISGYQINYAHGFYDGGIAWGLTLPSEPPLFSKDWWKLVAWFQKAAKKRGAAISLSDYTLGIGQGWAVDEIIAAHPEMSGSQLALVGGKATNALVTTTLPGAGGPGHEVSIVAVPKPVSIDPMHPRSGTVYAEKFFGRFESMAPGEAGKGLNFFFSDELVLGVDGLLWNSRFADEFKKRKGYDIVPELAALFTDIGPRTPKVRLDYNDVKVALSEEGYFKPVFDWHQKRGMTLGCDHGGRGLNVGEFGDYFRTQRWNQGPGADQPCGSKDLIKAKVAASIAHLYQRPRVWLEGFYASGWGTSSAGIVEATLANFAMGYNLLSLHGMYYTTRGGWWEWAPPDNTFRMPYWKHMRGFMDCVQRLSYLFSQGHHRCDVAILYPVAPAEAGMGGGEAVGTAFKLAGQLYGKSIDFDFMDFESLDRARIVGKELHVSGEIYRVLVLPAMKAVRHSTLQKALAFHRAGGVVLAQGALPEASDRVGRDDPEVASIVRELFPDGPTSNALDRVMGAIPVRDYEGPGYVQHRRIGPRDLYAIYNAPKGTQVCFRAVGKVELWDPWTGAIQPLAVSSQTADRTTLNLPLTEKEMQLVVFSPGQPDRVNLTTNNQQLTTLELTGDWEFELQPTSDNRYGDFHWPATKALIGAEVRQLWYCEGASSNGPWRRVTVSYGPQFIQGGRLPPDTGTPEGKPLEFSWRWGIENKPCMQGWWGLKGIVDDELIGLDPVKPPQAGAAAVKQDRYLWTTVVAPRAMKAYVNAGLPGPAKVWLNGVETTGQQVALNAGGNTLALYYDGGQTGRTHFVLATESYPQAKPRLKYPPGEQPKFENRPLASRWWNNPAVLPFDIRPGEAQPVGWYRFLSPPGFRAMTVSARGKVQAWADGKAMVERRGGIYKVATPSERPVQVMLRIVQERGCYGGATLPEPIRLECGPGLFAPGDWSWNEGLVSYSGGAWYRKTIPLRPAKQVTLDLGNVVSSAELRVNGRPAGVRVSPPWTFDITQAVKAGDNRIELLVCNTLANHYTTVPTSFCGWLTSGLLGPVSLKIEE